MAIGYLRGQGLRILATNYRNQSGRQTGEIDIIAKEQNCIVFVEVKTRLRTNEGERGLPPESAITRAKLLKMQKTAQRYLDERGWREAASRYDAVSVELSRAGTLLSLRHIEDIYF